MNAFLWMGLVLSGCGPKNPMPQSTAMDVIKDFETEIEQFVWLSVHANQSMMLSIRCTVDVVERTCYLGASNEHPISIDDTRLGIPLSQQITPDGWVTVQGTWRPDDGLLDSVDFRVESVVERLPSLTVVLPSA